MWESLQKMKIAAAPITESVLSQFQHHQPIDRKIVKTPMDDLVGALALVFDLNFKESYDILKNT